MRWVLALVAGCGRVGFESSAIDVLPQPAVDARSDVVLPQDATTILTGTGCAQPPPFIWLSAVDDNIGTLLAHWCSAGIVGEVTAYLMTSATSARDSVMIDIDAGQTSLFVGGAQCFGCFVRLDVAGYRYDGPPTDWSGD